jgi:tetratricopeptide (TPR) repeat protein
MSKPQKKKILNDLKNKQIETRRLFLEAVEIFLSIELYKQAGQCYYSAENYEKALECYLKSNNWKEAGECYFLLELYEDAAEAFYKGGDMFRAVAAFEKTGEYGRIMEIISDEDKMSQVDAEDRDNFLAKYLPLALGQLIEKAQLEVTGPQLVKKPSQMIIKEAESESEDEEEEGEEEKKLDENKSQPNVSELTFDKVSSSDASQDKAKHLAEGTSMIPNTTTGGAINATFDDPRA